MKNKEINICLLVFGNAARAFCSLLLSKQQELKVRTGYDVNVIAIATMSKGSILNYKGIDLVKTLRDVEKNGRFEATDAVRISTLDLIKTCKAFSRINYYFYL